MGIHASCLHNYAKGCQGMGRPRQIGIMKTAGAAFEGQAKCKCRVFSSTLSPVGPLDSELRFPHSVFLILNLNFVHPFFKRTTHMQGLHKFPAHFLRPDLRAPPSSRRYKTN